MASKTIELAGVGPVTLTKRAGSRSIRLSITTRGVRVSMPFYTPFSVGQAFVARHTGWIQSELAKRQPLPFTEGQRIGKLHILHFERIPAARSVTSRVTGTTIVVKLAPEDTIVDISVQDRTRKAVVRALKREASALLPPRLEALAAKHHKPYRSIVIKQLTRRWGSCDRQANIVLNLFLMELPWDQIDYVLLHELTHTVHMNHSADFWTALTAMQPRARDLARTVRKRQPGIANDPHYP